MLNSLYSLIAIMVFVFLAAIVFPVPVSFFPPRIVFSVAGIIGCVGILGTIVWIIMPIWKENRRHGRRLRQKRRSA